jgi:hypothetical protein
MQHLIYDAFAPRRTKVFACIFAIFKITGFTTKQRLGRVGYATVENAAEEANWKSEKNSYRDVVNGNDNNVIGRFLYPTVC